MNDKPVHSSTSVVETLFRDYIKEQRATRRWNILSRTLFLLILFFLVYSLFIADKVSPEKIQKSHIALIDIRGGIFDTTDADADKIASSLKQAFEDKKTEGVILRINSPGGSPVQASYIFNEIQRLKKLHEKIKIYAVCTDICASAAYYIAAAADAIYANPSSLVGSIGVLYNGFGFVGTLEKIGVERRLFTSGAEKGFLDPFKPLNPNDESKLQKILNATHQQFIDSVIRGRGARLKERSQLFSGMIWVGTEAKELGLIDGFGSAGEVARDVLKNDNIVDFTIKPNVFEQLSRRLGESFAGELAERAGLHQSSLQ